MQLHDVVPAFEEFAASLVGEAEEEWWGTDREIWEVFAERFIQWRFGEEIARQQRYKQYLELKKEFEGAAQCKN